MLKNTQTICWLLPMNCVSVFDYFLGLALEGLNANKSLPTYACKHSPYEKRMHVNTRIAESIKKLSYIKWL